MARTATRTKSINLPARALVAAMEAEVKEQQRKQQRRERIKRLVGVAERRWITDQHLKVAGDKQPKTTKSAAEAHRPSHDDLVEQQRAVLIKQRNRNRRKPWYATTAAMSLGLLGHGLVALFSTTSLPPEVPAGMAAGLPFLAAAVIGVKMERAHHRRVRLAQRQRDNGVTVRVQTEPTHRKWFAELTIGAAAYAGLVFWIATAGVSWWTVLVALLGTIALGSRWWNAHPLGPGVPRLEPPRPAARKNTPKPLTRKDEDHYAVLFRQNIPQFGRLTNHVGNDHIEQYDVELPPGKVSRTSFLSHGETVASALGLDPQQVILEKPNPSRPGEFVPANRARLTIIKRDMAAGVRYWTQPRVQIAEDGTAAVITNLARFRDGRGEATCTIWNRDGMVPTTIFGGTGSGKSAAVNAITIGALSTGLLNMIYVDFKGNSSGALRSRARIVVVGRDAVTDVRRLLKLLADVRIKHDPRDKQFPTPERPGWFVLLEEIAKGIKSDPNFAREMENMATTVRSLGIWPVSTAHDMVAVAWGNSGTRAAFSKQSFVFHMNTTSDDLINGLTYRPSSLPTYGEGEAGLGQESQPVPGWAVGVNTFRANVPARWDWLPADDDPVDEEPPYRVSTAWDAFARQPEITDYEYAALVDALGEPNPDGRWIIGIGGTHHFRTEDKTTQETTQGEPGHGDRPRISFLPQRTAEPNQLSYTERRVLQVIEGGTTKTGEIEQALAAKMSRPTVHRALDALVGANRIHRLARGEYALGPAPS